MNGKEDETDKKMLTSQVEFCIIGIIFIEEKLFFAVETVNVG